MISADFLQAAVQLCLGAGALVTFGCTYVLLDSVLSYARSHRLPNKTALKRLAETKPETHVPN